MSQLCYPQPPFHVQPWSNKKYCQTCKKNSDQKRSNLISLKLIIDQSNICFQSYPSHFSSFSFAKQKYLAKYARKFLAQYRQSHIQLPNMSQHVVLRSQKHSCENSNQQTCLQEIFHLTTKTVMDFKIILLISYRSTSTPEQPPDGKSIGTLTIKETKAFFQILHGEILVKEKYLLVYSLKAS